MIVITAPTSRIGAQVVDALLATGAPLRLVARDPSKLPAAARERATVVEGSHGDAAVVDRACAGADAVFWLTPVLDDARTLDESFAGFARPACAAFARHGVARVVGISALGRGTGLAADAGAVTASLAMDDAIAATGVAYRAVVCPSFMDNLLDQADAIAGSGTFSTVVDPDRRAPTVATRDIAATAAQLLLDDSWSGTGEIACLGPEELSPSEMARIVSDVLGREITCARTSGQAFKERMLGFGMSDAIAQGLVDMFEAKDRGLDVPGPRTPRAATPTTFRRWCEEELVPRLA